MREGLALLVRLQPDMQLVGAMATLDGTLRTYSELRPDVTLMDLDLPSEAALGAIRKIRAQDATARIIGLTTHEPDAAWGDALAAGASQCLAKDRLSDSLPALIRNGRPAGPPENGGKRHLIPVIFPPRVSGWFKNRSHRIVQRVSALSRRRL
jgi:DNA-binding NarL/FixJ family response regulator